MNGPSPRKLIIAIDGPAASGKTTVARLLAQRLGVVYVDTGAWQRNAKPLFSNTYQLTGKPDYLVRERNRIIPVEVKSRAAPDAPYLSHVMQLAAYCLLVEDTLGAAAPYGYVHYRDRTFKVEFTRALRAELLTGDAANQQKVGTLLDQMLRLQRRRIDLQENEQRELGKFLTPVQRAKYFGLQAQLRKRMMELRDQPGAGAAQLPMQRRLARPGVRPNARRPFR